MCQNPTVGLERKAYELLTQKIKTKIYMYWQCDWQTFEMKREGKSKAHISIISLLQSVLYHGKGQPGISCSRGTTKLPHSA
jgi:hypothetical protein